MLRAENLTKKFSNVKILDNINIEFAPAKIYGILGTNGAGKSTLLRTLSGIYKSDGGKATLNNSDVYENIDAKSQIFYIPDEEAFFPKHNITECIKFYKTLYSTFDIEIYNSLHALFKLDEKRDIKSFSKGMKKQALLLITLSFVPKYIILDETFDGLDPLIRVKVKKFLIELVEDKDICLIVSTHNISDIESLVDTLIIVNENKVLINDSFDDEDQKYYKVGVCFKNEFDVNTLGLNVKDIKTLGSIYTIIFENEKSEIEKAIRQLNPIVFDIVPLTKEELFMLEVEGL